MLYAKKDKLFPVIIKACLEHSTFSNILSSLRGASSRSYVQQRLKKLNLTVLENNSMLTSLSQI